MGINLEKAELREQLKKERSVISADQRRQWDQNILTKFWQTPDYLNAESIMVYLSFGDEINTWPILARAWADGKSTLVPKIRQHPKEIIAVKITSEAQLQPGLWGIYEPRSDEAAPRKEIDLIVVPGLAFNQQGYRIGYGGGYYDRFLPQTIGRKVGFCYSQFVREFPVAPWDQPVDLVITPEL